MKKNEAGRSMVEMLGVLAIIAILSVTGIYAYTLAMRRYKVNEIAQTATMLAIMARSADHGSGECLKLSKTNLPQNPGGVDLYMEADADASRGENVTINIEIKDTDLYTDLCPPLQDLLPFGGDCSNGLEKSCE